MEKSSSLFSSSCKLAGPIQLLVCAKCRFWGGLRGFVFPPKKMEGTQWWAREQAERLGTGYAWNSICNYVWCFSSKAVACRCGEDPGVPQTAALEVCFGCLWLVRGSRVVVASLHHVGCPCGLTGPQLTPAAWCGPCPQQHGVTEGCVLLSLLSD